MNRVSRREWLILGLLAAGITAVVHHGVTALHLINDDYLVLRPWSRAELVSTLTGTWDPSLFNELYHRPLQALLQAAEFSVFGINARALHWVSLAGIAAIAWLIGLFVLRETGSRVAAGAATLVFVAHPSLPDAVSAGIFNHMHIATCLLMLAMMLLWQRVRAKAAIHWWPVLLVAAVSFYFKEDTVMVLPGLITAQFLCARLTGVMPSPPRGVLVMTLAIGAALGAIRLSIFPQFVDATFEWLPSDAGVWRDRLYALSYGPWHTLIRTPFADGLNRAATVTLDAILAFGLVAAARAGPAAGADRRARWTLWIIGFAVMAWVNLPGIFMGGWTRDHLVLVAAVLVIAAAADATWRALTGIKRAAAAAVMVACLVMFTVISQRITAVFAPCYPGVVRQAGMLLNEPWLWPDLRQYLESIAPNCAADTLRPWSARDIVMWRAGPWSSATGETLRALEPHAVALVRGSAREVIFTIRHPNAAPDAPVRVRVHSDGRDATVELTTAAWREIAVPLTPTWRTRLRDASRVDLLVEAPASATLRGVEMQPARVR